MRVEFIEAKERKEAEKKCPWASIIKKVIDGFMCFESIDDFKTWNNQK